MFVNVIYDFFKQLQNLIHVIHCSYEHYHSHYDPNEDPINLQSKLNWVISKRISPKQMQYPSLVINSLAPGKFYWNFSCFKANFSYR